MRRGRLLCWHVAAGAMALEVYSAQDAKDLTDLMPQRVQMGEFAMQVGGGMLDKVTVKWADAIRAKFQGPLDGILSRMETYLGSSQEVPVLLAETVVRAPALLQDCRLTFVGLSQSLLRRSGPICLCCETAAVSPPGSPCRAGTSKAALPRLQEAVAQHKEQWEHIASADNRPVDLVGAELATFEVHGDFEEIRSQLLQL